MKRFIIGLYSMTPDLLKEIERLRDIYDDILKKVKEEEIEKEKTKEEEEEFSKINLTLALSTVAIIAGIAYFGSKDS